MIDNVKETMPTDATKARMIRVVTPPDKDWFADHMVFRHEAPIARIGAVMTVIAHHPVVVHLESIRVSESSIDIDLSVLYLQIVVLIDLNWTLIDSDILHV